MMEEVPRIGPGPGRWELIPQQVAQTFWRLRRQQRSMLQKAQKQMIVQGAGGAGAAPQQIEKRWQQEGEVTAMACGHGELVSTHLTALDGDKHQLAQNLAHMVLLLRGEAEDQWHPQPVGQEAL